MTTLMVVSIAVRMVIIMLSAVYVAEFVKRRQWTRVILGLGIFAMFWRLLLLQILSFRRSQFGDADEIIAFGRLVQSPQVSIWAELLVVVGLSLLIFKSKKYFGSQK